MSRKEVILILSLSLGGGGLLPQAGEVTLLRSAPEKAAVLQTWESLRKENHGRQYDPIE